MTRLKFSYFLITCVLSIHCLVIAQPGDILKYKEPVTEHGLVFEKETENRFADSSYSNMIQLLNSTGKIQAMQFRLQFNKASDDNTVLIFEDIQKGSDLSDPSWLLDYNVIKGSINKNGSSQDEIYVVLYNLNQNGGLSPGDYKNLFNVNYRVSEISGFKDNIKSTIKISHAEASTFNGSAINIKSSREELKILIKSKK
jgi:hypothetical protein